MRVLADLRYNLANLANFGGRQTRRPFWTYAIAILLVMFAGGAAVVVPGVFAMVKRMQQFAVEHPEQAHVESGPGYYSISIEGYHPELMPDMGGFMILLGVTVVIVILLLAAAVSRRLHDRGKAAVWGLAPVPFLAVGLTIAPTLMQSVVQAAGQSETPDVGRILPLFFLLFFNNMIYLAALGYLAYLLSGASEGDNRYGPAPS
ncbi:DUF805 domain-containing protein [Terricaulis sp.]|uniref:DUF805 domain-containing protein n=1 Tax=Terricaulis sp. TaxID=2768686 RepID=UPI0037830380